jgi:hypothetical protein
LGWFHNIEEYKKSSPTSIQQYVDELLVTQAKLIQAAIKSQETLNATNLAQRRKLDKKRKSITSTNAPPKSVSTLDDNNSPCYVWSNDHTTNSAWIELSNSKAILEDISSFDIDSEHNLHFSCGDYVLRRYPSSKVGTHHNPNKWGTFWRGPYIIVKTTPQIYTDQTTYYIKNLVTMKEYATHIEELKPFYYDPAYINPVTIAVRNEGEYVVGAIKNHGKDDNNNMLWLVHWQDYPDEDDTWEPQETLKDVGIFQDYCLEHKLYDYIPKSLRRRNKRKDA